ncbi:MAG: adenosine kinase [Hyphomicrobiales bacterium]|nr:adenosine kinase [Hyphomicrobiales bacterium]
MSRKPLQVVGIGNAIVDIMTRCDDVFLAARDLPKGIMRLIDAAEADRLYAAMGPAVEISGGSAANTCAGLASFGAEAGFIGRVADDQLGSIFGHDIRAIGVAYDTAPSTDGAPTAKCLILVTPDGERTMNTFLGASVELGPQDLDRDMIRNAEITYLEGYLFDPPEAKAAFHEAVELAGAAGNKVALSLSDPFCVERHRAAFRSLIQSGVDLLFANEDEILALYEVSDFEEAVAAVRQETTLAALTRGGAGSLVVTPESVTEIAAVPVDTVVDTTGAGDLYAAGFLYGVAMHKDHAACGRLASLAAAEVISHIGARPEALLEDLARAEGLIATA